MKDCGNVKIMEKRWKIWNVKFEYFHHVLNVWRIVYHIFRISNIETFVEWKVMMFEKKESGKVKEGSGRRGEK